MEYDSDITICSSDFEFDENEDNNEINDNFNDKQRSVVNDVQEKILNETQETNFSTNILDGFDLDRFVHDHEGKDGDSNSVSQVIKLFKGAEELPNKECNDQNNLQTQSTFYESTQSQSLMDNAFEFIQNNLPFCQSDVQNDELIKSSDTNCNKKNDLLNDNLGKDIEKTENKSIQNTKDMYDSQKTQLYSFHGFTDNYTHVSQSQIERIEIQNNHLFNIHSNDNKLKDLSETKDKLLRKDTVRDNESILITESFYNKDLGIRKGDEENMLSNNCQNLNNENIVNKNSETVNYNTTQDKEKYTQHKITIQYVEDRTDNIQDMDVIDNEHENDVENSQAEIVSFKVIEELNRVKTFLNKKDRSSTEGYATDSGYKSDSQSRGSFKGSLHLPDKWVNQSAHCLLNFVMSCPMVLKTRGITNEISWVLGRLIDKLHDEEKYPSFLDQILEIVESLLREVHEGDSYVEDVILQKDEKIQRLFLLNRSYHIMKYTIEKITTVLEKFHSQINGDSVLEIVNIVEMENFSYILHILENLLKRHAATKDLLSQTSTQTSQDDEKFLKKSSITDIWRKKWNPNYRVDIPHAAVEDKCVEVKCSEILNKIIVKAMDGYSLISFAALQCFNLLQS